MDKYLKELQVKKKSVAFDRFVSQVSAAGDCPVRITNNIIGGKWKPVVFNLILHDVNRFGEMLHLIEGLSKKVLTTQLRELETDGIVTRTTFDERPLRVEYHLTDKGKSLTAVLDTMCMWGLNGA